MSEGEKKQQRMNSYQAYYINSEADNDQAFSERPLYTLQWPPAIKYKKTYELK